MKKFFKKLGLPILLTLLVSSTAYAAINIVPNGGTGVGTITGIPYGTGTAALGIVTIGSGLSFTGATINISSSYVGQTSITTLGTIGTGVWQGNPIGTTYGGTGCTSPSITCFNNITGYTVAGATGTTSTNLVFSTSPTLTTPTLGVASATSVNRLTITTPATGSTLTIVDGKTLKVDNTLEFAGTDSTVMTFPGSSDTVTTLAATQTLTNKRITARVNTITSSSTPTPAGDTTDEFTITALAVGATFATPTGTPVDGQKLIIRIKDNGSAQTLAWNAIYRFSSDIPAPTTTIISKTFYLGFIYNSADSKWDNVSQLNNF